LCPFLFQGRRGAGLPCPRRREPPTPGRWAPVGPPGPGPPGWPGVRPDRPASAARQQATDLAWRPAAGRSGEARASSELASVAPKSSAASPAGPVERQALEPASAGAASPEEASPAAACPGDTPAVGTVGVDRAVREPALRGRAHPNTGRPGIAAEGIPHPRRAPVACPAGRQVAASPAAVAPGTAREALAVARWASARAPAAGRAGSPARSAAAGRAGYR